MKLIEASVEIIPQPSGLDGIYKQIEIAGRTCYRSENYITEDSAKKFVDKIGGFQHYSVYEHGTVYLYYPCFDNKGFSIITFYRKNPYSVIRTDEVGAYYITTNYRVLVENNRLEDLEYLCEPTEYHERRITARFVCSRSITHELVRHRVFSYSHESQRYCGYHKNKFNGEIKFIIPQWIKNLRVEIANTVDSQTGTSQLYLLTKDIADVVIDLTTLDRAVSCWYDSMKRAEDDYMFLIMDQELKPEEARSVLPNDCSSEIVVTGFARDWEAFFKLRTSKAAHPDMRELAISLQNKLKNQGSYN